MVLLVVVDGVPGRPVALLIELDGALGHVWKLMKMISKQSTTLTRYKNCLSILYLSVFRSKLECQASIFFREKAVSNVAPP